MKLVNFKHGVHIVVVEGQQKSRAVERNLSGQLDTDYRRCRDEISIHGIEEDLLEDFGRKGLEMRTRRIELVLS